MELFFTFVKIGLFTFGGGYAIISMIENNCVEKKAWITHDEMMDVTVIAESTPGPIAINCATFIGYKKAGFLGALVATLGIVVPSFIVIFLISIFLDNFLEITIVANAFKGIKVGVARILLGGNTLLAHCVGAGKSFEMMAACMEQKRLGLANKTVMIVPKPLIGQTASEFLDYILLPTFW